MSNFDKSTFVQENIIRGLLYGAYLATLPVVHLDEDDEYYGQTTPGLTWEDAFTKQWAFVQLHIRNLAKEWYFKEFGKLPKED